MSVQEFSRYMQANQPDYDFSEGIAYSPPSIPAHPEPVPPQLAAAPVLERPASSDKPASPAGETVAPSKSTVESTKEIEGALAKAGDSASPKPSSPTRDFFTVGSTKDEVLAVQGTPDNFTDSSFSYGGSSVYFERDKVKSWRNGYPKLKAKLLPSAAVEAKAYFTVGSTKDEVLAVQGTPDNFTDSSFNYGGSSVYFERDKVKSWRNGYPKLKAKLLPSAAVEAKAYFTVGSTKDEVLAVQGTPDNFTDSSFNYGGSSVYFERDRVKSWRSGYPELKARLMSESSKRP